MSSFLPIDKPVGVYDALITDAGSVNWRMMIEHLRPGSFVAVHRDQQDPELMTQLGACGLEYVDTILRLYTDGFPASEDSVGDWGTCLRPMHSYVYLYRVPPEHADLEKQLRWHGVGGLNIEAGRNIHFYWPSNAMAECHCTGYVHTPPCPLYGMDWRLFYTIRHRMEAFAYLTRLLVPEGGSVLDPSPTVDVGLGVLTRDVTYNALRPITPEVERRLRAGPPADYAQDMPLAMGLGRPKLTVKTDVALVLPSTNAEHFFTYVLPSLRHLRALSEEARLTVNMLATWDGDWERLKWLFRFELPNAQLNFETVSEILFDRGVDMSDADAYVLVDEAMSFSPGTQLHPQSSGVRYLEAVDYLNRFPEAVGVVCRGPIEGGKRRFSVSPVGGGPLGLNRGLVIRDMTFTGTFIAAQYNNPGYRSVGATVPNTNFTAVVDVPMPEDPDALTLDYGIVYGKPEDANLNKRITTVDHARRAAERAERMATAPENRTPSTRGVRHTINRSHLMSREEEAAKLVHEVKTQLEQVSEGVSKTQLAEELGISRPRVSQLMSGDNLSLKALAELAWAMGYRVEISLKGPEK